MLTDKQREELKELAASIIRIGDAEKGALVLELLVIRSMASVQAFEEVAEE